MAIQAPDTGIHSRFLEGGLTRYSYDEIISSIREFEECEQEYKSLADQAFALIKPHEEFGTMGIDYAPKSIQALYWQMNSGFIPGISLGSGKEQWPVKTWQKSIASYRTLNRKVRKAISVAQKG